VPHEVHREPRARLRRTLWLERLCQDATHDSDGRAHGGIRAEDVRVREIDEKTISAVVDDDVVLRRRRADHLDVGLLTRCHHLHVGDVVADALREDAGAGEQTGKRRENAEREREAGPGPRHDANPTVSL